MNSSILFSIASVGFFSLATLFVPRSFGALLAYEGFDYATGSTLAGQAGGTGFLAPWGTSAGTATIQSPGMTYDSLVTSGNGLFVDGTPGTVSIFRDLSFSRGADGTTTWISMMHIRTGAEGGTFGPGGTPSYLRPVNLAFFEGGAERFALGEGTRNQAGNLDEDVFGTIIGGAVTHPDTRWTTTSLALENFAVMRIDHGVTDTAYLWMNPALAFEPSIALADATITTTNLNFNRIRPFAGNPSAQSGNIAAQGLIDEIRIGETFFDVAPVPEPSTWALLGLGLLAFLTLRRK